MKQLDGKSKSTVCWVTAVPYDANKHVGRMESPCEVAQGFKVGLCTWSPVEPTRSGRPKTGQLPPSSLSVTSLFLFSQLLSLIEKPVKITKQELWRYHRRELDQTHLAVYLVFHCNWTGVPRQCRYMEARGCAATFAYCRGYCNIIKCMVHVCVFVWGR